MSVTLDPILLSTSGISSSGKRIIRVKDVGGPLSGAEYTAYGHVISGWFKDISIANFDLGLIEKLLPLVKPIVLDAKGGGTMSSKSSNLSVKCSVFGANNVSAIVRTLTGALAGTRLFFDFNGPDVRPRFDNRGRMYNGTRCFVLSNTSTRTSVSITNTMMLDIDGRKIYHNYLGEDDDILALHSWSRLIKLVSASIGHPYAKDETIPMLSPIGLYNTFYVGYGIMNQVEGAIGSLFGYPVLCSHKSIYAYKNVRSCGISNWLASRVEGDNNGAKTDMS